MIKTLFKQAKKLKYKQHDITDCGAACLASVLAHHGLKFPISRIRQYASTDTKGTNVLGMVEAAEKLGLTAKGVKGPFESLFKVPKPCIAHIVIKDYLQHYVVIYKTSKKFITIMDPADGKFHQLKHNEFKKQWTGTLILLLPSESFEMGNHKTSIKKRFWQLIRPHSFIMSQALTGAAVFSLLGISTSIYVEKIVDYVLVDGNNNLLNLLSVIMIVILFLRIYLGVTKSIFTLKTGQKIDAVLILGYYKHLMKLPQRFFDTMRVGEIISRVNDAVKIRRFINDISLELIVSVFYRFFHFCFDVYLFVATGIAGAAFYPVIYAGLIGCITGSIKNTCEK
jgi:ABC-type bacteriocin/lantibiotic exporter with double-glycine peptidase domain